MRITINHKKGLNAILTLVLILLVTLPCAARISKKQEVQIGRQGAVKLEKKYGLVKDPELVKRVRTLGQRIAAQGNGEYTYHFGIIKSKDINALAFPGGYIYFTKGIVDMMPDELLAFVAGHEISHVEHRDSVKAIEKAQMRQVGMVLLQSFVKETRSDAATSLLKMTDTVIGNRYSQSAEFAADENGMYLMTAAGYDPYKAIEALEALNKAGGKDMPGFLNSLVSTHPITADRIKRARALAPKLAEEYKRSHPDNASHGAEDDDDYDGDDYYDAIRSKASTK